jgi:O-antigen/teichoic acid export membrane protein
MNSTSLNASAPISSAVWLVIEKLISVAMSFLVTLAVARHLLPDQFGELNYLIALASLVFPILALGLNSIISRELIYRPNDSHQIIGSAFAMRALTSLCIIPIAVLVASVYLKATYLQLFTVLMLFSVFHAAQVVEFWLQAHMASRYGAMVRLISLIIFSVARLCAVKYGASFSVFVYLAAFEMGFMGMLYILTYHRLSDGLNKLKVSLEESKQLVENGRWLIISGIAAVIYLKIDQVMLGIILDEYAVGVYSAAAKVSEVWYFVPAAIAASFFPGLLEKKRVSQSTYQSALQKINDFLLWVGIGIALSVSLLSDWLILLFGEAYQASVPVLVTHVWAGIFVFTRALLSKWLITENLLKLSMLSQVLGAVANVLLNIKLIPLYGPTGAAYATVISYGVAGYLVLFSHRDLWPMAIVMTKSALLPIRLGKKGLKLYQNR